MNAITVVIIDGRVDGYLTIREFAKKHFVTYSTAISWVRKNRIDYLKIGSEYWIPMDEKYPEPKTRGRKPVSKVGR